MEYTFFYKGKEYKVSVSCKDSIYSVAIGKEKHTFEPVFIDSGTLSLKKDNETILCRIFDDGSKKTVFVDGDLFELEERREQKIEVESTGKAKLLDKIIKSPMPGSVVKLNVKVGDQVKEGDILIIVEAMKMENELRAPGTMKVKGIHVKEGDQVKGFAPLIELE